MKRIWNTFCEDIRKNPHTWWKGAINGRDPEFVTFSDKAYGYRAVFITLNTYNRSEVEEGMYLAFGAPR